MYFTVNTPLLNSMNACKMNVEVVMINKTQMVKGFCSSCSPLRATLLYRDLPNLMWHLWVSTMFCITAEGTETLVVQPTAAPQTMIYMSSEWDWGTLIWKTLQSQRKAIKNGVWRYCIAVRVWIFQLCQCVQGASAGEMILYAVIKTLFRAKGTVWSG